MRSPRIMLIGIYGVYNYGCEAIVRGTEAIIRQEYPDANIAYASYKVEDDLKRLEDSEIQVVERKPYRRYSIKNICRKLLHLIDIKWSPMVEPLGLLKDVDVVLSVGGDIYTLGPTADYPSMSFPKFGDAVQARGIPYVLWGASVGPFTENPKIEKKFKKHLKGLSLIAARETATVEYLRALGISNNVVSCADPAYVVAPEIKADGKSQGNKFTIGINISPLSMRYMAANEEVIYKQSKSIEKLIKTFNAHIVLIPHVVCHWDLGDDDLQYLRNVKQAISAKYHEAVKLIESDPGFIGIKKELIKCNLVMAARMHCAINALTAHVPTIFIAYSHKAMGMCNYVYGNSDWVISLPEFALEGVLEEKVRLMQNQENICRDYLTKRIPEIQLDAYKPMERMKKILASI